MPASFVSCCPSDAAARSRVCGATRCDVASHAACYAFNTAVLLPRSQCAVRRIRGDRVQVGGDGLSHAKFLCFLCPENCVQQQPLVAAPYQYAQPQLTQQQYAQQQYAQQQYAQQQYAQQQQQQEAALAPPTQPPPPQFGYNEQYAAEGASTGASSSSSSYQRFSVLVATLLSATSAQQLTNTLSTMQALRKTNPEEYVGRLLSCCYHCCYHCLSLSRWKTTGLVDVVCLVGAGSRRMPRRGWSTSAWTCKCGWWISGRPPWRSASVTYCGRCRRAASQLRHHTPPHPHDYLTSYVFVPDIFAAFATYARNERTCDNDVQLRASLVIATVPAVAVTKPVLQVLCDVVSTRGPVVAVTATAACGYIAAAAVTTTAACVKRLQQSNDVGTAGNTTRGTRMRQRQRRSSVRVDDVDVDLLVVLLARAACGGRHGTTPN